MDIFDFLTKKGSFARFLFLIFVLSSCQNTSSSLISSTSSSSDESISSSSSSVEYSSSSSSESSPSISSTSFSSENSSSYSEPERKIEVDFLDSTGDVYSFNINTENNQFPYDKETYVLGQGSIVSKDGTETIVRETDLGIKLRGNSTLQAAKKSFKIKFDKKRSIFGLKPAKKWVLMANYYDKTNIRNYLAYKMAGRLSNLDYQPSTAFIDVYINNVYQGLYLLTEQVEAKEGRVEIDEHFDAEGHSSFLFEVDDRAIEEYGENAPYAYFRWMGYLITPKYPDPDDYLEAKAILEDNNSSSTEKKTAQQTYETYLTNFSWLKQYLEYIEANLNRNNFDKYFDVGSLIDYYFVQETFKNVDVASTSQYYYLDQADMKIHAGPVWDFDISAGVVGTGSNEVYTGYTQADLYVANRDPIYRWMFSEGNYLQDFKDRYSEIRDQIREVLTDYKNIKVDIEDAQNRNLEKWPIDFSSLNTWIEQNAYCTIYKNSDSYSNHCIYLKSFLNSRLILLDNSYLK